MIRPGRVIQSILLIILSVALAMPVALDGKRRSSQSVRRQQQQAREQVRQTQEEIRATDRLISSALTDLGRLQVDIDDCNAAISRLNTRIDSIRTATEAVNDSIEALDRRLASLRKAMTTVLRDSRRNRASMSRLAFIFASSSFEQAFSRLRALKQFDHWRSRKAVEIKALQERLDAKRIHLQKLQTGAADALSQLGTKRATLAAKQTETNNIVASLRGKERQLGRVLNQRQQKAQQLDEELNRLIEQEQREAEERARREREAEEARRRAAEEEAARRAAEEEAARIAREQARQQAEQEAQAKEDKDKKEKKEKKKDKKKKEEKPKEAPSAPTTPKNTPTTSQAQPSTPAPASPATAPAVTGGRFGENKGKLPWPIDGQRTITKRFGRQRHPSLPYVETDNSGIDILTAPGATVKSVYDGTVSAIFCPDGYNNVVVVRHGNYVTVYANLGSLSVRKGDKVSLGQALGKVFIDPDDDDRSVLHFEIRNATNSANVTKENPEAWLR